MQAPCQERDGSYMFLSARFLQKSGAGYAPCPVITERPQVVICLSSRMKLSLRFRLAS